MTESKNFPDSCNLQAQRPVIMDRKLCLFIISLFIFSDLDGLINYKQWNKNFVGYTHTSEKKKKSFFNLYL